MCCISFFREEFHRLTYLDDARRDGWTQRLGTAGCQNHPVDDAGTASVEMASRRLFQFPSSILKLAAQNFKPRKNGATSAAFSIWSGMLLQAWLRYHRGRDCVDPIRQYDRKTHSSTVTRVFTTMRRDQGAVASPKEGSPAPPRCASGVPGFPGWFPTTTALHRRFSQRSFTSLHHTPQQVCPRKPEANTRRRHH